MSDDLLTCALYHSFFKSGSIFLNIFHIFYFDVTYILWRGFLGDKFLALLKKM